MDGSSEDLFNNLPQFKAIFSAILSPEGMKTPVLKKLCKLLHHLSSNSQWIFKCAAGSHDFELEICHDGTQLTFQDVLGLSNVLFKELDERFELLFLKLCGISGSKDHGESSSCSGILDNLEVTILLFRCCMLLLILLEPQHNLILGKGGILFKILRKLSWTNVDENTRKHVFVFEKSVFREFLPDNDGCASSSVEDLTASLQILEPSNPLNSFMCIMLEVFVDELLVNGKLSSYFKILNSFASIGGILFNPNSGQGNMALVMESLCNHFIISFLDVQAFGDFLNGLFCGHGKDLKYPFRESALSATSAVSLFLNPIITSAPKYMQAHLFSLVYESIDVKNVKLDRKCINYFLSTFEKSVILYMRHISCLQRDLYSSVSRDFTSSSSHGIAHPPFECYILPETKYKVDSLVTKLDNSSDLILNDCCFRMKSDLVSSAMRFVKECQNNYAISCEDDVLCILSCLVLKASECYNDKALQRIETTSLQQLYLLASLLRLMSISLIKSIWSLRHTDGLCRLKTLKDFSSSKEYDFILGAISCFRDLDISLPLQKVLSSVMSDNFTQHMESKMMFLHFSGLMSLCFASGLDCLVKACLLIIFALLNLFIFEEGNLDALKSFVDSEKESCSSKLSAVRLDETMVDQNATLVVASKFQKIRALYSSEMENIYPEMEASSSKTIASAATHIEAVAGLEQETEETSNGEVFLRCMLRTEGNVSDFDDLASFVECKRGKDYSDWLKNRQKYRRRRGEKMAVLRWKKKKKAWKTLKVNRN